MNTGPHIRTWVTANTTVHVVYTFDEDEAVTEVLARPDRAAVRHGNVLVEGRDEDMINRGGEKVSAEEVGNLA